MSVNGSQTKAQVDKLLTNVSNMYKPANYVCERILTPLAVMQDSGILPSYGNQHLRLVNSANFGRARARLVNAIERDISRTYQIVPHELRGEVSEQDYVNVEAPYDAEKDETEGLTEMLWIEKEYNLSSVLRDTSIITQNVTLVGAAQFNNYASSNPVEEIKSALGAVHDGSGRAPNKAIMSWAVYNTLRYHPQVLDNLGFKDNRAGTLKHQEVADFLNVDELLVSDAFFNAAKEGQADDMQAIWGKDIVFVHCPSAAAKKQVSLGYMAFNKGMQRRVKKWQIEETFGNTGLLVGDRYSFELVNTTAAYVIKNAIA
jgi:hypothetical protein